MNMIERNKRNTGLIALALASICAASVYAQSTTAPPEMGPHHGHMMGGGPGRVIPLLLHSTDLTADQETQVHQLLDSNRSTTQGLVGQVQQANKDLTNLLLGPNDVQADAVSAQLALIAQRQQQLAQHEANTVLAIRALLTPEQLAKAAAAQDQMPQWHHGKHSCDRQGS